MKVEETNLTDCLIIEPDIFEDERGYFFEGFNHKKFTKETGVDFHVKQINQSRSSRGVLRGLHFQTGKMAQAKLVSCMEGELLDVAVDLRKDSPTYGEHAVVRLSAENKKQLYIPKGMAHGFLFLSDQAKLMYLVDELYSREHDTGIMFNDPDLNISWGMSEDEMILSQKDQTLPLLKDAQIIF